MKVREPVARPVDVVAVELLLSASQAFVVGVLMYLAIGIWDERGVGHGPVAIILALLGLAVGGAWVYWLLGGVGWPLAAANVPVSMFLGFALVLGWTGSDLFRVTGVPLLLATLAAIYGIVGGVFIDSPRRWRWDQRQKLRPGTTVPHVSPTTRMVIASVPRSVPRRVPPPPPSSELATRIERSTPSGASASSQPSMPSVEATDGPSRASDSAAPAAGDPPPEAGPASDARPTPDAHGVSDVSGLAGRDAAVDPRLASDSTMPTRRLSGVPVASIPDRQAHDDAEPGGIVLPTSVEPKAQRSPWAWAAPPEWTRDEDDAGAVGQPPRRS